MAGWWFRKETVCHLLSSPKLIDTPQPQGSSTLRGRQQAVLICFDPIQLRESLNLGTPCVCMLVADGTSNWEPSGESDGRRNLNLAVRTSSDAPTASC